MTRSDQSSLRYFTPSTSDGGIESIQFSDSTHFQCVVSFPIDAPFAARLDRGRTEAVFAARSRLCRLGVDLTPIAPLTFSADRAELTLAGRVMLRDWGVEEHLRDVLTPAVRVGRLVACDRSERLSKDELLDVLQGAELLLPDTLEIRDDGSVAFRGRPTKYSVRSRITRDQLFAILTRRTGKQLLEFLQVPVPSVPVTIGPHEVAITSCSMFLNRHYILLEPRGDGQVGHLNARVLDPVSTRGAKIYLEFENTSEEVVRDPRAIGFVYRADSAPYEWKRLIAAGNPSVERDPVDHYESLVGALRSVSRSVAGRDQSGGYMFFAPGDRVLEIGPMVNHIGLPGDRSLVLPGTRRQVHRDPEIMRRAYKSFDEGLRALPPGPVTLFARNFPNLSEHPALLRLAASGKLKAIVFEQPTVERGAFFSERDHVRMADLLDFGVNIYWCNEIFRHVAQLCTKDGRAYFSALELSEHVTDTCVAAIYGSTVDLDSTEAARLVALLKGLRDLFGPQLAFMTGGGGGVMRLVLEAGSAMGAMVGCNFLENADQNLDHHVSFYQTFQASARHMRQRWFEVARFHIFAIGGVGTMEEIGLTLTDIKLGLLNDEPIVLFGSSAEDGLYWRHLAAQLRNIEAAGRGPAWLRSNVLVTNSPEEVIDFYRTVLRITDGQQERTRPDVSIR
jgi:predicted Rossmann-fold nucleotide-binding protein